LDRVESIRRSPSQRVVDDDPEHETPVQPSGFLASAEVHAWVNVFAGTAGV
jgi:hypothetical protein